jgi:hypothetical protein
VRSGRERRPEPLGVYALDGSGRPLAEVEITHHNLDRPDGYASSWQPLRVGDRVTVERADKAAFKHPVTAYVVDARGLMPVRP